MKEAYQGSCLCAAVSYLLLTPPKAVSHCHCSQCRKSHGAAFASYGSVPRNMLRILRGATNIKAFASSPTVMREFCAVCGSSLFWSRSQGEFADWVSIALGTLDTPFLPKKQQHLHLECAAPWHLPAATRILPAG
ncbi:ribulose-phosphate 3-epimerase [Pseudomonas sp. 10-1B]|uniref:GFA family protein n=1 Tax=Pseudomonas sp. 10-1B TaxID=1546029 RepID=UPI00061EEE26|nr:GFA family protein [Pseudomonas sp. 10-1B]KIY39915.1 ribulose-phosphate 3-epimerase [Pseudomonas sp. 10-1B]